MAEWRSTVIPPSGAGSTASSASTASSSCPACFQTWPVPYEEARPDRLLVRGRTEQPRVKFQRLCRDASRDSGIGFCLHRRTTTHVGEVGLHRFPDSIDVAA